MMIMIIIIINTCTRHTLVHIEGEGPHSNADHALRIIEKFDSFSVKGEVSQMLRINVTSTCV